MIPNHTVLMAVPLLEGLSPDDLNVLTPNIETCVYEKGETLFLIGDPGGALMIVASGVVELFVYDDDEKRIVLSRVALGGFFGEVSLFDNTLRTANAIATERTEILILRQNVMVNFLRRHPDAALHVINILSKRLRDTTQLVVSTKERNAYDMLEAKRKVWERIADHLANAVGSWMYLTALIGFIIFWIILNLIRLIGIWDLPPEFNVLNLTITILGALQLPLILMSQKRQNDYERIQADLDHQVNVRAQLSILEVTRKLDWLQQAMMNQTVRLEDLERDHILPEGKPQVQQ
jgi:CRP/FNR family transcriptional regulator, cyclic AMP receptor protein